MQGARGSQVAQTPGFMHGLNLLADAAAVTPAGLQNTGDAGEYGGVAAAPHFLTNTGTEEQNHHGRALFPNTPAANIREPDNFLT